MSPQKSHLHPSTRTLRWARVSFCLALLAGLLVPALADEKKATSKKEDKDNKKSSLKKEDKDEKKSSVKKEEKPEKQEAKDKMVPLGAMVCRISRIEGAQKNITVQISHPVLQPVGRSFRVSQITRDFELQPSDDMKVRLLQPPADFDVKGRPKKYTAKELKDMKGSDPKLPGYAADFDSLKPDQVVKVYLAAKKDAHKSTAHARVKAKGKDAEDAPAPEKPEITMIVILGEPKK
jgi:hypothetical protein